MGERLWRGRNLKLALHEVDTASIRLSNPAADSDDKLNAVQLMAGCGCAKGAIAHIRMNPVNGGIQREPRR